MERKENEDTSKKCFIITPVGKEGSLVRREMNGIIMRVVKPVLFELGFEDENIYAAHLDESPNVISTKIFSEIVNSDLVIANLSDNNPNVMYEIAMAHCFNKPIVHIIRDVETLPFDLKSNRIIEYKNDIEGSNELSEKLKRYIENALAGEYSNPVIEALTLQKIQEQVILQKEIKVDSNIIVTLIDKVNRLDYDIRKKTRSENYRNEIEIRNINHENYRNEIGLRNINNELEQTKFKGIRYTFINDIEKIKPIIKKYLIVIKEEDFPRTVIKWSEKGFTMFFRDPIYQNNIDRIINSSVSYFENRGIEFEFMFI